MSEPERKADEFKKERTDQFKVLVLDDFNGNIVRASVSDLREKCLIRHAYALTIHKFQVRD